MEPKSTTNSSNPKSHQEVQIIAIGILLILLVGVYFFGRAFWKGEKRSEAEYQSIVSDNQESTYPTITPESLQKIVSTPGEKYTLIDIRPREEYTLSHIANSLSYPDDTITSVDFPTNNKVIVIGNESDESINTNVAKYLSDKDISFAFLKGGHSGWVSINSSVVTTGDPGSFVDQSKIKYITSELVKTRFQNGERFFVLDIQPAESYRTKHLKDAVNIPLTELEGRIAEVPSGQKILVYGRNEAEAFQAGVTLFDLNIFGVEVLSGDQVLNSGLFTEGQ